MNIKTLSIIKAACAAVLISIMLSVSAFAKHITVALDVSGSSPLLINQAFNVNASKYIKERMQSVKVGDVVTLRFIGSLNSTKSLQKIEETITHHNKAIVKKMMEQVVLSTPKRIKPEGSTNLIAFFGRNHFDCANGGEVVFITDGIEASEYIKSNELLIGKANIPKPNEYVQLKGCIVTFYGIGTGRSDTELNRLRKQWRHYFKAAGAEFRAIPL